MKKAFCGIVFLLSALCCNGATRADSLRSLILDGGSHNYVMIFAHRGDWRNAPAENSLSSYKRCIDIGIDGIEVDLQMTRDSVLVVMHDDTLNRTTTGTGKICDHTLDELKSLQLLSPIGVSTMEKIPTFKEVLELAKGKILIQVDKWPNIKDKVIHEAQEAGCLKQIILRSSLGSETFKKRIGILPDDIIYIPVLVCNGRDDEQKMKDQLAYFNSPIMSFSFKQDDYSILDSIPSIKQKGYRIWLNSLWAKFNGGHDDELAMKNEEASYGWLLRHGADIIFSDNPSRLLDYLKRMGKRNR